MAFGLWGDIDRPGREFLGWLSPRLVEPSVDVTNDIGGVPLGVDHFVEPPCGVPEALHRGVRPTFRPRRRCDPHDARPADAVASLDQVDNPGGVLGHRGQGGARIVRLTGGQRPQAAPQLMFGVAEFRPEVTWSFPGLSLLRGNCRPVNPHLVGDRGEQLRTFKGGGRRGVKFGQDPDGAPFEQADLVAAGMSYGRALANATHCSDGASARRPRIQPP